MTYIFSSGMKKSCLLGKNKDLIKSQKVDVDWWTQQFVGFLDRRRKKYLTDCVKKYKYTRQKQKIMKVILLFANISTLCQVYYSKLCRAKKVESKQTSEK